MGKPSLASTKSPHTIRFDQEPGNKVKVSYSYNRNRTDDYDPFEILDEDLNQCGAQLRQEIVTKRENILKEKESMNRFVGMLLIHLMSSYQQQRQDQSALVFANNQLSLKQSKQIELTVSKEQTKFRIGELILTESNDRFVLEAAEGANISIVNLTMGKINSELEMYLRLSGSFSNTDWLVMTSPVEGVVSEFNRFFAYPEMSEGTENDFRLSPLTKTVVSNFYQEPAEAQRHLELIRKRIAQEGAYKARIDKLLDGRVQVLEAEKNKLEEKSKTLQQVSESKASFCLKRAYVTWLLIPSLNARIGLKQSKLNAVSFLSQTLHENGYNVKDALQATVSQMGRNIFKRRFMPIPSASWNRSETARLFSAVQKIEKTNRPALQKMDQQIAATATPLRIAASAA